MIRIVMLGNALYIAEGKINDGIETSKMSCSMRCLDWEDPFICCIDPVHFSAEDRISSSYSEQ
ncbi:hypothetical protein BT93_A2131 [Corymbia citriodora subsp. variegata]|nr:hypothetical protein BT93_A2131 [Corymbia citriodora subsp. variegata]